MENVYNKTKSEEVAPEVRGASGRACALLAVETFVKDLDWDMSLADESALPADRGACASAGFHRFCTLKENLVLSVAPLDPWEFQEYFGVPYAGLGVV